MRGGSAVLIIAGAVLTLGGCSVLPAAGPQPTTTPSAAPAALTADEAAAEYAETVCTFNAGAREFDEVWRNMDASLRDLQAAAALNLRETRSAQERVDAAVWPDEVAEDITQVSAFLETRAGTLDTVVGADSLAEVNDLQLAAPQLANAATVRIESVLGLAEGFCGEPEPDSASLYAGALMGTAWYGVDSDGDYTEVHFDPKGPVTVLVKGEALEAEYFDAADNAVSFTAVTSDGIAVDYVGAWVSADSLIFEATEQSTGATWTLEAQPI